MADTWYKITDRFSVGIGRAWGLGITYYPTPARRHHKVFTHWVCLRIVFAWHRRKGIPNAKMQETPSL